MRQGHGRRHRTQGENDGGQIVWLTERTLLNTRNWFTPQYDPLAGGKKGKKPVTASCKERAGRGNNSMRLTGSPEKKTKQSYHRIDKKTAG